MLTNQQLVQFVLWVLSIGAKYWYGTFGKKASKSLYTSKKAQYPSHYEASRTSSYNAHIAAALRVCDCVGLIKWFFWAKGSHAEGDIVNKSNGCPDTNANGMFKLCTKTGTIKTLPEIPGLVLWCNNHIGVYIGNGYAIEARGFAYGNVKTKVSERSWTHWGMLPMLDYVDAGDAGENKDRSPLSLGAKGAAVVTMQSLLLAAGMKLPKYGADGDFGSETLSALKAYQKLCGISATGICDETTWSYLFGELSLDAKEPEDNATEEKTKNPYSEPSKNIARGAKGNSVKWIQWELLESGYGVGASGIDGDFGSKTYAAVIDYQTDHRLQVDGIVGPKTRAALKAEGAAGAADGGNLDGLIIDISEYQGNVDWNKLAPDVSLVILRCGLTKSATMKPGIDARFKEYATECTKRGIPFGVYYFGRAATASFAQQEAEAAFSYAKDYSPLFYVYDAEDTQITKAGAKAFIAKIKALGAKKTGYYIAHHLYNTYKLDTGDVDFVWIPRYGVNNGTYDKAPDFACDLHQYTSTGKVSGISGNVDLNRLTGGKPLSWFLGR